MPASSALIAAAVTGGLGLLGAGGLWLASGDRSPGFGGDGLAIAVVAPVEPVPVAGPRMDVGEVVDGYEHHPFVQPAAFESDTAWLPPEEDAYAPLPAPDYRPTRVEVPLEPAPPEPAPEPEARRPGRWSFGFERPLPDFAAERRERRARRDAYEMAQRAEAQVEPAPGPDRLDPAVRRSPDMFY